MIGIIILIPLVHYCTDYLIARPRYRYISFEVLYLNRLSKQASSVEVPKISTLINVNERLENTVYRYMLDDYLIRRKERLDDALKSHANLVSQPLWRNYFCFRYGHLIYLCETFWYVSGCHRWSGRCPHSHSPPGQHYHHANCVFGWWPACTSRPLGAPTDSPPSQCWSNTIPHASPKNCKLEKGKNVSHESQ